jgi:2-C-methyl-D-erythritol 4-phosphate cytidylyltransferase
VAGAPLVLHALRPFLRHPAVDTVVLVLPGADAADPPAWLAELIGQRLLVVAGGAARQESAMAGLAALPSTCSVVVVHDGARPVVDDAVLEHILAHARAGRGAIAAFPVSDTLKAVSAEGRITATVPRDGLWRAQTPQGFPRGLLERAYAASSGAATDDAALVESLGQEVVVVPDSPRNLKVTTPDDFALVDMILRAGR